VIIHNVQLIASFLCN